MMMMTGMFRGMVRRTMWRRSMVIRGYCSCGDQDKFWFDREKWKRSAKNTLVCLVGCSIGEFATLYSYSVYRVQEMIIPDPYYYVLLGLPLMNGLLSSLALETAILKRQGMDVKNAFQTAMGMSFISMLVMEVSMEIVDLYFTNGTLAMDLRATPLMLSAGFFAAWPYNYYRLKKYGASCH